MRVAALKIKYKKDSRLMYLIAFILNLFGIMNKDKFINKTATTIGKTIYLPSHYRDNEDFQQIIESWIQAYNLDGFIMNGQLSYHLYNFFRIHLRNVKASGKLESVNNTTKFYLSVFAHELVHVVQGGNNFFSRVAFSFQYLLNYLDRINYEAEAYICGEKIYKLLTSDLSFIDTLDLRLTPPEIYRIERIIDEVYLLSFQRTNLTKTFINYDVVYYNEIR
jgi:hypothetical protein